MVSAIIVAAGSSIRMGAGRDKLFQPVAGRPLVAHTWSRFDRHPEVAELVLVVRAGAEEAFQQLAAFLAPAKPFQLVRGGKERQESVRLGLHAVSASAELVLVHDGARPCCPAELITATLAAARESGAAVAAQRVSDTIKESSDGRLISRHLDRSLLWAVQTPQTFRLEVLRAALAAAEARGLNLTDDTAACELIGQPVRLVECSRPNPKATTEADFALIERLLDGTKE